MVLDLGSGEGPKPKCFFYTSHVPNYIDSKQPPTKKQPFKTILDQQCGHAVDLLVPSEGQGVNLIEALSDGLGKLQYAKVHMKLSEIIEGDFFNQYIKTGNIMMLSEGRRGMDNVFSLVEGILRLEVDKATYERLGLEGKAIPSEGRKHVKARYVIELNLRLPSMVRGKKGFERVVWAFKNVLDHSLTWLFYDMRAPTDGQGPIATHSPIVKAVEPKISESENVIVPQFPGIADQDDYLEATELLEWLTLCFLESPRTQSQDNIDSYISRYETPVFNSTSNDTGNRQGTRLTHLRWRGFIPSSFVSQLALAAMKVSSKGWFALSARSFSGEAYTVLKTEEQIMVWNCSD